MLCGQMIHNSEANSECKDIVERDWSELVTDYNLMLTVHDRKKWQGITDAGQRIYVNYRC